MDKQNELTGNNEIKESRQIIGRNIKEIRSKQNLSQKDLAGMIGVSPSTIFNPALVRSSLIRLVFELSSFRYSSLFSFNKFNAAFALAIVAGESAVENMKGLDLLIR